MDQEQQAGQRSGEELKKLFRTLSLSSFLLYFGFNAWRAVFNRFLANQVAVRARLSEASGDHRSCACESAGRTTV